MLAFIHIPKTAGSSVNVTLEKQMGYGMSHIEAHIDNPEFKSVVANSKWISGHVPRIILSQRLAGFSNDVHYITFVRSPVEQLISHIKWQFAIFDKGHEFILSHPLKSQLIALEAMNVDYQSSSAVIDFLNRYRDLFLNYQSRCILSNEAAAVDSEVVRKDCSLFSLIGTTTSAYALLSRFFGVQLKEERENVNDVSYFDEEIFRNEEVLAFINKMNARDVMIYEIVKNELEPRLWDSMEKYNSLS